MVNSGYPEYGTRRGFDERFGDLGHVVIPPEKLRVIRRQEARRAGEMVGIEVISAGFSDLDIFDGDRRSRDRIVDVIRYADPDVIITQAPDDYMPDHTAVSRLVFDASFAATLPNYRFLADGDIAVGCFNFGSEPIAVSFTLDELGLNESTGKTLAMRELWTGETLTVENALFQHQIAPYDCLIYRCRVVDK